MVARNSQRAFICFECQLHRLRYPPNPTIRAQLPRQPFSSSSTRFAPSDSAAVQLQQKTQVPSGAGNPRTHGTIRQPRLIRLRKLRGKDGKEFSENSVSLAVQSLGKPAEVIIIRDAKLNKNPPEQEEELELENTEDNIEENKRISGEIIASLKDGQAEVSQDIVNEQINKLWPVQALQNQPGALLTKAEYERVVKLLRDRFTTAQLLQYAVPLAKKLKSPKEKEWPIGWSFWRCSSQSPTSVKNFDPKYARSVPKTKPKLIRFIVEALWRVETAGEAELVGQITGTLKTGDLMLLTSGRPSRLDALAEQSGVKFQVNRSTNMIVVTGSKFSTLKAAHNINSIRDTSVSDSFALPVLFPSSLKNDSTLNEVRNEDLEAIGALTSTVLNPTNKGTGEIAIRGSKQNDIMDARRAIVALVYQPKEKKSMSILSKPVDAPFVLLQTSAGENLPLRQQRIPFGRWNSFVSRPNIVDGVLEPQANDSLNDELKPNSKVLKALRPVFAAADPILALDAPPEKTDKMQWKQNMDIKLSASIGHVLHRTNTEPSLSLALNHIPRMPLEKSIFLKRVPNLFRVIPHMTLDQSTPIQEILSFKLLPSWVRSGVPRHVKVHRRLQLFPEITVDFVLENDPDNGRLAHLHGVFATVQEQSVDIMTPSYAADVRFKRTVVACGDVDTIDSDESLNDFIRQSNAIALGGGILHHTRPISVRMPKNALSQIGRDQLDGRKRHPHEQSLLSKDEVEVDYMFASAEHRQTIPLAFGQHSASLTSVESGKIGGGWQELLLHLPVPTAKALEGKATNDLEQAIQPAFALLHMIDQVAKGALRPPPSKRQLEMTDRTPDIGDSTTTLNSKLENKLCDTSSNLA